MWNRDFNAEHFNNVCYRGAKYFWTLRCPGRFMRIIWLSENIKLGYRQCFDSFRMLYLDTDSVFTCIDKSGFSQYIGQDWFIWQSVIQLYFFITINLHSSIFCGFYKAHFEPTFPAQSINLRYFLSPSTQSHFSDCTNIISQR